MYSPYEVLDPHWTGSVAANDPGTISHEFRLATVRRANYFRALCRLPAVSLDEAQSGKCQHAALITAANKKLSHYPTSDWKCWTPEGAEAASNSNLGFGSSGPAAINCYIYDEGSHNAAVGHRRWVLYPPLSKVGTGSVPYRPSYWETDALWVIGNEGKRPTSPEFVAWPTPGWFPKQHLSYQDGRWSFSLYGADWSQTSIDVTRNGASVKVVIEVADTGVAGDPTIVFCPENGTIDKYMGPEDVWVVEVNSVLVGGKRKNYSYTVRVFNPSYGPGL